MDQDDHDEHHPDRRCPRQAGIDQLGDAGLNQERDQGSKDERAKEIAKQIEDHYRDRKRREAEGDLKVAAPQSRVKRPSGDTDST